jgi:transposase
LLIPDTCGDSFQGRVFMETRFRKAVCCKRAQEVLEVDEVRRDWEGDTGRIDFEDPRTRTVKSVSISNS